MSDVPPKGKIVKFLFVCLAVSESTTIEWPTWKVAKRAMTKKKVIVSKGYVDCVKQEVQRLAFLYRDKES